MPHPNRISFLPDRARLLALLLALAALFCATVASAQVVRDQASGTMQFQFERREPEDPQKPKGPPLTSLRHIPDGQTTWQHTVWMRADLRSQDNAMMFAPGKEVTKLIFEAIKAEKIVPFANDSLTTRLDREMFLSRLELPESELPDDYYAESADDSGWEDEGWSGPDSTEDGGGWSGPEIYQEDIPEQYEEHWQEAADDQEKDEPEPDYYDWQKICILEIKEKRVFLKSDPKQLRIIESVSVIVPGEYTYHGLDIVAGVFSFRELCEQVFLKDPEAVLTNFKNPAAPTLNLAYAFDSHLFSSYIIKFSNPQDRYVLDIVNDPRKAYFEALKEEYELLEKEAVMWSY